MSISKSYQHLEEVINQINLQNMHQVKNIRKKSTKMVNQLLLINKLLLNHLFKFLENRIFVKFSQGLGGLEKRVLQILRKRSCTNVCMMKQMPLLEVSVW